VAETSEARKRHQEARKQFELDAAMLREANRLNRSERVLRCLQQVYGDATALEGDALRDALEDEELLR
jgi:hypothetical protein